MISTKICKVNGEYYYKYKSENKKERKCLSKNNNDYINKFLIIEKRKKDE